MYPGQDKTRERAHLALLLPDSRTDRHNVYVLHQERKAQSDLGYNARTRVDNVVPLVKPDEPRPAA